MNILKLIIYCVCYIREISKINKYLNYFKLLIIKYFNFNINI